LQAEFQERRGTVLHATRGELVAVVGRTRSADELEQWVARALLPASDARVPAGAEVLAQVERRREGFERNQVLGRAPTAPAGDAATVPPPTRAAPSPTAAAGEPSEENIYQALRDYFKGVSDNAAELVRLR
jgi:hypothetical protein